MFTTLLEIKVHWKIPPPYHTWIRAKIGMLGAVGEFSQASLLVEVYQTR